MKKSEISGGNQEHIKLELTSNSEANLLPFSVTLTEEQKSMLSAKDKETDP